jgi:glutamine synthetase adenylyltransferase
LIPGDAAARLLEHYDFLKRIEILLRGDSNRAVSLLAASPEARAPLARWLGFADEAGFWAEYCRQLAETRQIVLSLLPQQP